jgi:hypothetical protein
MDRPMQDMCRRPSCGDPTRVLAVGEAEPLGSEFVLVTVATSSTAFAINLARAHAAAIAAFHGECRKAYDLLSDKQRAELVEE